MPHPRLIGVVVLAIALDGYACDHSTTAPSPSPAAPAAPAAPPTLTVTKLVVTGNTSLAAIGETSQMTASATLSDGTTKNVTSDASWSSTNQSVVTVSPTGVVTCVAFGVAFVQAAFNGRSSSSLQVTATPAGTFIVLGRVREPGNSGIGQVQVLETQSGQSTLTNSDGIYSMGGLTASHLRLEKGGFEVAEFDAIPNQSSDTPLQKVIRLSAGESVTPLQLAPHDMSYTVGTDRCFPCRLIRIMNAAAGTLRLTLTWTGSRTTLNLWTDGRLFVGTFPSVTADVAVAPGELVVYVGWMLPPSADGASDYVPFTLATTVLETP
jgi:hypothetical protein